MAENLAPLTDEDLADLERARRLYRTLEMSAGILHDPDRNGGWEGAERTADAFRRQAEAARDVHSSIERLLAEIRALRAEKAERDEWEEKFGYPRGEL